MIPVKLSLAVDDPVTGASENSGRNAFTSYTLPEMVLRAFLRCCEIASLEDANL